MSSSELEYVALSETFNKVMFMIQLLGNMKKIVEYPVTVRVENVFAIFMASNVTATSHTKHVDTGYKYDNEYVKDQNIKIIFVKSAENDRAILTKNLSSEFHKKNSKKMVG